MQDLTPKTQKMYESHTPPGPAQCKPGSNYGDTMADISVANENGSVVRNGCVIGELLSIAAIVTTYRCPASSNPGGTVSVVAVVYRRPTVRSRLRVPTALRHRAKIT